MNKCKKCGLGFVGSTCPGCGTKSEMSTGKKIGIAVGAVVVALIGFAAAGGNSSSSSQHQAPPPAIPPEAETPPTDVTARALWEAYDANEVSADDKFKGKKLLVAGTINSIDKDFTDHIVVRLAGGKNHYTSVDAFIRDADKEKAAELRKGQDISLLCIGDGKTLRSPILKPCMIR
jgi:hypothetical protein